MVLRLLVTPFFNPGLVDDGANRELLKNLNGENIDLRLVRDLCYALFVFVGPGPF